MVPATTPNSIITWLGVIRPTNAGEVLEDVLKASHTQSYV